MPLSREERGTGLAELTDRLCGRREDSGGAETRTTSMLGNEEQTDGESLLCICNDGTSKNALFSKKNIAGHYQIS